MRRSMQSLFYQHRRPRRCPHRKRRGGRTRVIVALAGGWEGVAEMALTIRRSDPGVSLVTPSSTSTVFTLKSVTAYIS